MSELRLDAHGQHVLVQWQLSRPPLEDIVLVEEVLQFVEEGGAFWSQWWTRQDLTSPGDWVVHPREGLELVLRLWTGEEPALFSVLRVGDVGRPELPDA